MSLALLTRGALSESAFTGRERTTPGGLVTGGAVVDSGCATSIVVIKPYTRPYDKASVSGVGQPSAPTPVPPAPVNPVYAHRPKARPLPITTARTRAR